MEGKMVQVTVGDEVREYPDGICYVDIVREYQREYQDTIMLVMANGKLRELHKHLHRDCELKFVTVADEAGHKTYKRSASMILTKAVYDIAGKENVDQVMLHFSIGSGYYYTVKGRVKIDEEFLAQVRERMRELVNARIPFYKRSVRTDDAVESFRSQRMMDKVSLFEFRRVSRVNLYSLEDYQDYYYGFMAYDTGYIPYFDLVLYDHGFVLQLPERSAPTKVPLFVASPKIFQVQMGTEEWGDMLEISTVGELNQRIVREGIEHVVLLQEALQETKLSDIAQQIIQAGHRKFIMIAGPSSSGKTTFSHRLSIQLAAHGLRPHPIAVDNYFVNREDTPLDEFGNKNYECLEAIDVEAFNRDMMELLQGKRVELPEFNFKTGQREYKGNYLQLGKEDVLVIEGIHGLNDKLSYALPKESKFKIYISALTQLNVDEHNRIPTTDGRLIRRIVRDAKTRGTSARETIAMWPSVRRGEEQNIFPFQEEADVMFNSALIYELACLKVYAEPLLFGIPKDVPEYLEAKRLLKFFDYFIGVPSETVPKNSILREFIGESCFNV